MTLSEIKRLNCTLIDDVNLFVEGRIMDTTERIVYKPDFPYHNYMELQRSHFGYPGDTRHFGWETTYHSDMKDRGLDQNEQKIDTIMLQRTHWNPGDLPGHPISENHDKFIDYKQNVMREQEITRDMMMKTNFDLTDGTPMQSRTRNAVTTQDVEPSANLKEFMTATHFDLKSPSAPKWETTSATTYQKYDCKPAESAQMNLNKGLGAKATFDNLDAFGPGQTLYNDTFRQHARSRDASGRIQKATVENDHINFIQNTTNKWQKTNMKMGDTEKRYSTTSGDALTPRRGDYIDPHYAKLKRIEFHKSSVNKGNNFPSVTTTTAHDAVVPHPECRPPPLAEKTAFISHQDHRNWNGRPSTTMSEAYYAKKAEKVDPVNNQLQTTHACFGHPNIHEMQTLYNDTFTKPPKTHERADMDAMRNFHMSHHSKTKRGDHDSLETTTYNNTFTGFPGVKPSDMCDALKGGHNIVPNDPRMTVKESEMKADFKPYKGIQPPPPIDNLLQRSHIQLKGGEQPWSTSQQEYFQYETYRLPGDPRYGTKYEPMKSQRRQKK